MKPKILKWIYLGLVFLILGNTLLIVYHPAFMFSYNPFFDRFMPIITLDDGTTLTMDEARRRVAPPANHNSVNPFHYPILSFVIVISSIVVIIGLIKIAPWSRVAAISVLGIAAIEAIGMRITEFSSMADLLQSFIFFDIIFLFLAYKIYTSNPLKIYLSKPQLGSR